MFKQCSTAQEQLHLPGVLLFQAAMQEEQPSHAGFSSRQPHLQEHQQELKKVQSPVSAVVGVTRPVSLAALRVVYVATTAGRLDTSPRCVTGRAVLLEPGWFRPYRYWLLMFVL